MVEGSFSKSKSISGTLKVIGLSEFLLLKFRARFKEQEDKKKYNIKNAPTNLIQGQNKIV